VTRPDGPILFFDGVCNLCAASVHFVLERERTDALRFASLQSTLAKELLVPLGVDPDRLDSLVLLEDGRVFVRSTAALRLAARLRAPWSWLRVLRVVPALVRDGVYDVIARHRYRWFGRKAECLIPTPALRARFLA
jgi:predicted DCC family thiol-disulfide oxidoreductase YuxK